MEQEQPVLKDMRKSLDNLDNALIYLLAERFRVTDKVGVYKKQHNLAPVDGEREALQFARIRALAEAAGLEPGIAEKVLRVVINEAVRNHKKLREQ